jgi:type II secretory pathway component PulC
MDFLTIKNWHLFGYTTVSIEENNQLNEEPQKTDLQIKLLGVFFLPNQKTASYAIIEGDDKQQKKYRAGDEMPNSIILQSIAKDQVILLRNQQAEYLSMDRTKLSDYN